ncbi:MAG: ATPase, T2SS/T4P/T4SS family [Aliidongia sp.]
MRPDRIILGEIRGTEAFDMLQAMNTGHDGSMSTVHANTPRRRALPPREHGAAGQYGTAREGHSSADLERRRCDCAGGAHARRRPPHPARRRSGRNGRRSHYHPGPLHLQIRRGKSRRDIEGQLRIQPFPTDVLSQGRVLRS